MLFKVHKNVLFFGNRDRVYLLPNWRSESFCGKEILVDRFQITENEHFGNKVSGMSIS